MWGVQVRELELQIGLVQQLNSQGLRKEEAPVTHATNTAPRPDHARPSDGDSAASGDACTAGEKDLEPGRQRAGLRAESAAGEGTPGRHVDSCTAGEKALDPGRQGSGLRAESAAGEGTPGRHVAERRAESASRMAAPAAAGSADGATAAAPMRSAAERAPADAADAALTIDLHPSASTAANAAGSETEERSLSAASSGATEQATRRKPARKPFYYGPRNTALEQSHCAPAAAAAAASAQCEAMPSRQNAESESVQTPKPKRKPFAYGPRPSNLDASKPELAVTAVERLGTPARTSRRLEEKVAAAGTTCNVAMVMAERSTRMPAGAIFVHGESPFKAVNPASCGTAGRRYSHFSHRGMCLPCTLLPAMSPVLSGRCAAIDVRVTAFGCVCLVAMLSAGPCIQPVVSAITFSFSHSDIDIVFTCSHAFILRGLLVNICV